MSKIIIGIHGLGNKPPKDMLENWWLESMCEGLTKINKLEYIPKFELVYWADILNDKPLSDLIVDKENPYFLDEPYVPSPEILSPRDTSTRKKFLGFLEHQMDKIFLNNDLTPNFTFISDLVFKKYFKELDVYYSKTNENKSAQTPKSIIRNRLYDVLKKHKGKQILLIAHSMGSIIAYDVCTLLASEIEVDTFVTMGSPLGMPIIVSKIAEEQKLKLPDLTKLCTPNNVINSWINYSDLEDNVAINYNLADDYGENHNGVKVIDFNIINDYEINGERNPHKSFGYLRTPEFSKLLAEFLTKDMSKFELWKLKTTEKIVKFIKNLRKKYE